MPPCFNWPLYGHCNRDIRYAEDYLTSKIAARLEDVENEENYYRKLYSEYAINNVTEFLEFYHTACEIIDISDNQFMEQ